MNADQVRALVAAKYPQAMQSPLAQAVGAFCAADEAARAVGFAKLQAAATCVERRQVLAEAMEHAQACIAARDGWTVETLGHNVESAFGHELDADECDDVAREALKRAGQRKTYTLWLLKDPCNGGKDLQCWFHHPDVAEAFRETRNQRFAEAELARIRRCNPGSEYELRAV